jgi:hypothetical protein
MKGYYSNPDVRAWMLEYLGGNSPEHSTCHYLTAGDADQLRHREPRPATDLPVFWQQELDISRSAGPRRTLHGTRRVVSENPNEAKFMRLHGSSSYY